MTLPNYVTGHTPRCQSLLPPLEEGPLKVGFSCTCPHSTFVVGELPQGKLCRVSNSRLWVRKAMKPYMDGTSQWTWTSNQSEIDVHVHEAFQRETTRYKAPSGKLLRVEVPPDGLYVCVAPGKCRTCDNVGTCFGQYEGHGPEEFSCDTCCGHGNEDGYCKPVKHRLHRVVADEGMKAFVSENLKSNSTHSKEEIELLLEGKYGRLFIAPSQGAALDRGEITVIE